MKTKELFIVVTKVYIAFLVLTGLCAGIFIGANKVYDTLAKIK